MRRLTKQGFDFDNDFCTECQFYGEPCGCNRPDGTCKTYEFCLEALEMLEHYEDAEDNGLLVRLPCKVGDTVYEIVNGKIIEMRIGNVYPFGFNVKNKWCNLYLVDDYTYSCIVFSDLGKTVFLSRKAAEQALKKAGDKHE